MGTLLFNGYCGLLPSKRCSNEVFMRINDYVADVSTHYPNHYAVNLSGAL